MKTYSQFIVLCLVLLAPVKQFAQHHSTMTVDVDNEKKILSIRQELVFHNQTGDTLHSIILNDWANSYSTKETPLAKRFSDEFVRSFHLAKDEERGHTDIISIADGESTLSWERSKGHPDLVEIKLANPILRGEKITLQLAYSVKIPSDRFTKYGYNTKSELNLKDWFLTPARYENHSFARYSNNNLDDIASGISDFDVSLNVAANLQVNSDLNIIETSDNKAFKTIHLNGNHRSGFSLFISPKPKFLTFKNDIIDVQNGLEGNKIDDIQKAIIVDRIVNFVDENLGRYPYDKITVSQADYERSPFYGLNQLPGFLNVFNNDFLYELKFMKTYINNYLNNTLKLDPRKDHWIYDGIQVYAMMKYIAETHPEMKMTGQLNRFKLLQHYNVTNLDFNGQYSYFYMLMARKNLDQPIGDPKNTLIKFNEQIAGKYRAGLSLKYLENYLGNGIVSGSIKKFTLRNKDEQTNASDFETILKSDANKNIDWFFNTVVNTRDIIDFKFGNVSKTNDSISFTVKNSTGANVPIPVYGIKKGEVVFKQWLENINADSTFTVGRNGADKIVLNYKNEVPEYNLRNNWKSLKSFPLSNRPYKFVFFKDLEDPWYNQILYIPTLTYNLYDGLTPGLRFFNKTILDKPFNFDVNPSYSTNTGSLTGAMALAINKNYRDSRLYNMRYFVTGSYFHYAPDAAYLKINPTIQFKFRPADLRDNRKQQITLREVILNREKTNFTINGNTENYSVFDARYINSKTEVTSHVNFSANVQAAAQFGKVSSEMQYRKLFDNNHEINLRLYAGTFLYNNTNTDFFSFALDRPTDYLFDYNYYGRSETTGFFSQQLILAEGGFKSKLDTPYANQWITTLNAGFNVWNWVEVYGDAGFVKNRHANEKFLYDSGVRLNLVTDYFELYLPVYSSNGWEAGQPNYAEKIRFIITLSPNTLINLFTRKWF
ncbi:MAG TPA: hypothetical protein VK623_10325 [Flavobacterium sp.]|nr:hypothetical protein [Flavobacterium sp.]